jgi:hypothetical protein
LNDADAEWCGQCMAEFESPEDSDPRENLFGNSLVDPEPMLNQEVENGLFGVEGGRAVWRCSRCFTRNHMEMDDCSECGLPFLESARREAGAFTEHLADESARSSMGALGWGARVMLMVGGLVAPIALLWTALASVVGYILKKALGRR